ncbi:dermonecrotic toxin domain-containing protein [Pseudomonas reactans]
MSTETPDPAPFDFDDPDITQDERLTAIRTRLTRRLDSAAQPSRSINQWHATQARYLHTTKQLGELAGRAPRILSVIRHALREAFALDPDTLLFREPLPPQPARQVDNLMDRTLALFRDPGVPINLHHFTALSLAGDPERALPFNAWEALSRVSKLNLPARTNAAMKGYWEHLAPGSWRSRGERWAELRKTAFADQAFLAHQVFQLSTVGYAMVKQLVDAPSAEARQRAGGAWATVQVGTLAWPHASVGALAIPGALHIYRTGAADGPQVIYLPGLLCAFHEFRSWRQAQQDLPERVQRSLLSESWHYLPLKRQANIPLQPGVMVQGDALAHSAQALLDEQWNNEWGAVLSLDYTAPSAPGTPLPSRRASRLLGFIEKGRKRMSRGLPFGKSLDALLEWDRQRRQHEIVLGSQSSDLPLKACDRELRRYASAVLALWVNNDLRQPSEAYQAILALEKDHQAQAEIVNQWLQCEDVKLFNVSFWLERPSGTHKRALLILNAQRRALRQAAQLEHQLGLIKQTHLDRLLEVLNTPLATQRGNSDTRVLQVSVGNHPDNAYRLMSVFVVTTVRALAEPNLRQPVMLVVGGEFGGLAVFEHLERLSQGLRASFGSRDGSVLWRYIGRDVRSAARFSLAKSVHVGYSAVDHDVLYEDFKAQVEHHARLHKRLDEPGRLFSEVSDVALGRQLLAQELREHLSVPINQSRTLALANVAFMRFAAEQGESQPAWLATATADQRKPYKRLQRRYVSSALALESRLWQILPPLHAFARGLLMAQLKQDGFSELDVDKPLLDMPDDVGAQYCGWFSSQCVVGDRHVKKIVSSEHTTFSLMELALHNLDALAPWTEWRLNRARYLQPEWKERLNPRYLIKTLSALDIGGHYDALIQRAFSPAPTGLFRPLIDRATQHLAYMQVYSTARRGLSSAGQSLFNTGLSARSPADLDKNGHQISLSFVRLRGYTMEHDRHIAGVLVIIDQLNLLCLVYWPAATVFPVLAEFSTWERARTALHQLNAMPGGIKDLARRVAPGWEHEALASYPGRGALPMPSRHLTRFLPTPEAHDSVLAAVEAIGRLFREFKIKHTLPVADVQAIEAHIQEQIDAAPTAWLDFVPAAHSDIQALLAHAHMLEIQQRAHARATSSATLARYREQRLGDQWNASLRGILSFVPLLGTVIGLYELFLAAKRYHHSRRPEDAVDVAFLTLMVFIDLLSLFVPGPKTSKTAGVRSGLNQLHRRGSHLSLPPAPRPVKVLERLSKPLSTEGALPLQGLGEKGVYVKNGELFLVDGEHRYPVYRRGDESALRVKSPGGEAEGELLLYIREDREWSLGADAPQPGPSSGALNPWREPVPVLREWQPPTIRAGTESSIRRSSAPANYWFEWRADVSTERLSTFSDEGVFKVQVAPPGASYNVILVGTTYDTVTASGIGYYRLLAQGDNAPHSGIAFITRDKSMDLPALLEIERWTTTARTEQPIPVSRTLTGEWQLHTPLFEKPLEQYVKTAFPTMTTASRAAVVARLVQLANSSRYPTATHLLTIRATLDNWLTRTLKGVGQTDDLLKMLTSLHRKGRALYIGYDGTTEGFTRVDFKAPKLDRSLRSNIGNAAVTDVRDTVQRAAVREVLEGQGFIVHEVPMTRGKTFTYELIAVHPESPSNKMYYVALHWFDRPSFAIDTRLVDSWVNVAIERNLQKPLFTGVKRAMREGRLERIMAGIQWARERNVEPSVYFVKVSPTWP